MAAETWAGRDYDLYIERTALMMPTIPVVVDGVSSTLIACHPAGLASTGTRSVGSCMHARMPTLMNT